MNGEMSNGAGGRGKQCEGLSSGQLIDVGPWVERIVLAEGSGEQIQHVINGKFDERVGFIHPVAQFFNLGKYAMTRLMEGYRPSATDIFNVKMQPGDPMYCRLPLNANGELDLPLGATGFATENSLNHRLWWLEQKFGIPVGKGLKGYAELSVETNYGISEKVHCIENLPMKFGPTFIDLRQVAADFSASMGFNTCDKMKKSAPPKMQIISIEELMEFCVDAMIEAFLRGDRGVFSSRADYKILPLFDVFFGHRSEFIRNKKGSKFFILCRNAFNDASLAQKGSGFLPAICIDVNTGVIELVCVSMGNENCYSTLNNLPDLGPFYSAPNIGTLYVPISF